MRKLTACILAATILAPASTACAQTTVPMPVMAERTDTNTNLLAPEKVEAFYLQRYSAAVWSDDNYDALLTALEGLENLGLSPDSFHFAKLTALKSNPTARDRLATDAWFAAAAETLCESTDFAGTLAGILQSGRVAESLTPKGK